MSDFVNNVKNYAVFIIAGVAINTVSVLLDSDFIAEYLRANQITVMLALLGINTATIGIVLSQIRDLEIKRAGYFKATHKALRASLREQVLLVFAATIFFVIDTSKVLAINYEYSDFIANSALISIFIAVMYILYDTGNAVFILTKAD